MEIDKLAAHLLPDVALLGCTGSTPGENNAAHHAIGGEPLRFRIVSAGAWSFSETIMGWQASQALVDPTDIVAELDRAQKATTPNNPGYLAMRAHLWVAAPASGEVTHKEGDRVDIHVAGCLAPATPAVYFDVEANSQTFVRIKMPPSGDPVQVSDVPGLVEEAVALISSNAARFNVDGVLTSALEMPREQALADIAKAYEHLSQRTVGFGFLKSCLQKLCRVQAHKVIMPDEATVDARIVAMVAIGLCFSNKGDGFVPDLGTFVRGQTAALKRLAVTCCEDAWPQVGLLKGLNYGKRNTGTVVSALLGASLLTVRIPTYNVPRSVVVSAMLINCMAVQTQLVVRWRGTAVGRLEDPVSTPCDGTAMRMAARLLRVVRSFGGDMDMLDRIADLVVNDRIDCSTSEDFPSATVPLLHCIDQHVYRGIGHVALNGPATFPLRFKEVFGKVTGFNPRLTSSRLDESTEEVQRVRFAESMIAAHVFPQADLTMDGDAPVRKRAELALDTGVLAGGVGLLGPFAVKTDESENTQDGDPRRSAKWNLLVCLGVEKPGEIVIHSWSAHSSDNSKKPKITASAKRKAIAMARSKGPYKFSSPVLPGYTKCNYEKDAWTLTGTPPLMPLVWRYDAPVVQTIDYVEIPPPSPMPPLTSDRAALSFLQQKVSSGHGEPVVVEGFTDLLPEVLGQLAELAAAAKYDARTVQLRLLAQFRQQYEEVALPVPGLQGDLGTDQLKAEEGDWLVYRALLWIARLAPGALRPKQVPKFQVVDARLLRIVDRSTTSAEQPQPLWKVTWTQECEKFERRFATPAINNIEPFDYQRNLVETMLRRDAEAVVKTRGHFVSLETGLGKSLVGVWYFLRHIQEYGDARRVIWVTPEKVVDTARTELQRTWGMGTDAVRTVDRANPRFDALVNIVGFEWYSHGKDREALTKTTIEAAPSSACVFDEVHAMYSTSIRTSAMRQVALICAKFVCMTATPIAGPSYPVAIEWLKDTVGFPVNRNNQLVASAMMVAARVQLPIEQKDTLVRAVFTPAQARQHLAFLQNGRNWGQAALVARRAAAPSLVRAAIEWAVHDRKTNPDGGVLLIADSSDEADEYVTQISELGVSAGRRTPGSEADASLAVVVTVKTDVVGYNFTRVGAIVTGVYAMGPALRTQLRGRIYRVGQTRSEVHYITVFTSHSILELLHQRHTAIDQANASMEELADVFVRTSEVGVSAHRDSA